ncbi:MAG: diacylglycerol kinase, partial [Rubrobacteraceae bacterium]
MEGKSSMQSQGNQQGITRSFEHAYRGLVYAFWTQRNMRIHVVVSVFVLVGSVLLDVRALELAAL